MGSINNHQKDSDNTMTEPAQVVAVMVPFPAQGHLNQLLQLSCLISSYGISVHYLSSAIHNRQAKVRVNGLNPVHVNKIDFHDIPTPPFESPAPNPNSSNKFPSQLHPAWFATLNQRKPVVNYLQNLSSRAKRVVVIHDPVMSVVVQDVALISNAESYAFHCISALCQASLVWDEMGIPFPIQLSRDMPSIHDCLSEEAKNFVALQSEPMKYRAGDIYNTCRLIEAPYLDLLEKEDVARARESWAIGPIFPAKSVSSTQISDGKHKCLKWLDKQEPKSVIYITFGTTTSLSDEQIKELAMGLGQSKQKFIWVLRDADKGDIFDEDVRRAELPQGFEERVEGIGMVVRDWAPQPEILAHPSTGGFMSHCGWNSCLESITQGVPIAAWPMHSDQPRNSMLVNKILKIGLVVREWTEREELVKATTFENVVKRLMASEEGDELRKRAQELAYTIGKATEVGGVSQLEFDSFIAHINR